MDNSSVTFSSEDDKINVYNNQLYTVASSPRDIQTELVSLINPFGSISYQKMPQPKETYLAYVVAIKDPLNLHLDIYWPKEIAERYSGTLNYDYTFVSEELGPNVFVRTAYSCHLKGVEIISGSSEDFENNISIQTANMKEAYILISKLILRSGGWVLVTVSDIDVYKRTLINIFDVVTRKSLNQQLLDKISSRTGEPIAKHYSRPNRSRNMFQPNYNCLPKDYHIIYGSK